MGTTWQADNDVLGLLQSIKEKNHPHLDQAAIALGFSDSKAFTKNRFNFGKTSKFSKASQLWHGVKYDFCITIPADSWYEVLTGNQREALLDLHLTRCSMEYEAVTVEVNGVKKPVKDEFGRVEFTDTPKTDDDGEIKWRVLPLDLPVFSLNAERYGLWCDDLLSFKAAIEGFNHE